MRRRNARGGISRTVSVYLDEDTNNRLIRAKDRSGRSKTIEVQIRLRDHLKRFPDFYNEEIFREVIEENESTFKEGANKRGNSSRLTQSFHFFMFEPIFSPVNALNQPI